MAKKLPKTVYIKWNIDKIESDEPFLEVQQNPAELREGETTILIGEYELKATRKLINETRME